MCLATSPAHNPDRAGSVRFKPGRINERERLRVGWEGYRKSRRCSREIYPESNITRCTSIIRGGNQTHRQPHHEENIKHTVSRNTLHGSSYFDLWKEVAGFVWRNVL